jgi:anaerobic selenocysteine-containing dehydrogenase
MRREAADSTGPAPVGRAEKGAVIFGSGVSASGESLEALLDLAIDLGADRKGLLMAVARAANAVGACAILGSAAAPHEVIADDNVKAVFFYEEDPFHYMAAEKVTAALKGKEFILAADALPTRVTEQAGLVVPTGVFTEKEGTFFAGDGAIRHLSKAMNRKSGPGYGGFAFLAGLLAALKGPAFRTPQEVTAALREKGLIRADNGREGVAPAAGAGEAAAPMPPSGKAAGSYALVVRDLFSNHHLAGRDSYSNGVSTIYRHPGYPVSEDKLFMSREDAAAANIAEGEIVLVQAKGGSLRKPLSVKDGLKPGVMEYVVFKDRAEVTALMETPLQKWIEVKVDKG